MGIVAMAQGSASIHKILDAEKEAAKIVEKAREDRSQRLRTARAEAQKDINDHGNKAKASYESYEKAGSGSSDSVLHRANLDTDRRESEISKQYQLNKQSAIDVLVDTVWRVTPEVHRNIKVSQ